MLPYLEQRKHNMSWVTKSFVLALLQTKIECDVAAHDLWRVPTEKPTNSANMQIRAVALNRRKRQACLFTTTYSVRPTWHICALDTDVWVRQSVICLHRDCFRVGRHDTSAKITWELICSPWIATVCTWMACSSYFAARSLNACNNRLRNKFGSCSGIFERLRTLTRPKKLWIGDECYHKVFQCVSEHARTKTFKQMQHWGLSPLPQICRCQSFVPTRYSFVPCRACSGAWLVIPWPCHGR